MKASVRGLEVFRLNSRVIAAIYYHAPTRRMVIQTAHGKFLVYADIDKDLPVAIAEHSAPGMFFDQSLKAGLKPKLTSRLSLSSLFLLRQIRRLSSMAEKNVPQMDLLD